MLSANSHHTVTPVNMIQFLALIKGEKLVLQSTISFPRLLLQIISHSLSELTNMLLPPPPPVKLHTERDNKYVGYEYISL